MKTKWIYIIGFVIAVLSASYMLRSAMVVTVFDSFFSGTFLSHSNYLVAGASTLILGALFILLHNGISNKILLIGEDKFKGIIILLIPLFSFSITGLDNQFGISNSLYGFLFAAINVLYAFTEEFGWRRYLQNALEGTNKHMKYLLIGLVWWIWHFRFDNQFDWYVFPLICLGGGYLLGKLADESRSITPVVLLHTLIILTTNSGNFGIKEISGIAISIVLWMVVEQIWKRKKPKHSS